MSNLAIAKEAPSPEKNPPVVNIELKKDQVKQVVGMTPGMQVKVVLTGKITRITHREPYDGDENGFVGDVTLEMDSIDIEADESGTMQNLLDD